ncbi:MAG: BMC domain-containing protein, partial [Propionicimonas sp.]
MLSLGQIEVVGLPAAIEAADVALKAANVELIGYEATDGMGMVAVKIVGQVGAVKAAMAAAQVAAAKINKVFSVSIIARPNDQIEPLVYSMATVGRPVPAPVPPPAPEPAPEPASEPSPEPEPPVKA